jgi:hypothetical protein
VRADALQLNDLLSNTTSTASMSSKGRTRGRPTTSTKAKAKAEGGAGTQLQRAGPTPTPTYRPPPPSGRRSTAAVVGLFVSIACAVALMTCGTLLVLWNQWVVKCDTKKDGTIHCDTSKSSKTVGRRRAVGWMLVTVGATGCVVAPLAFVLTR